MEPPQPPSDIRRILDFLVELDKLKAVLRGSGSSTACSPKAATAEASSVDPLIDSCYPRSSSKQARTGE